MPGGFFPWRRKPAPGPPVSPPKASSRVAPSEELSQLQAQLKVAQAGRRQVRQELDTLTRAKRESEQALAGSQQKVTGLQAEVERLTDVTKSLESQLAASHASFVEHAARVQELEGLIPQHATLRAARDTQIAALASAEDQWKQMIAQLTQETANQKTNLAGMQAKLARLSALEAEHARLKIEYDAVDARCDVARAQLAEVEHALENSQATIKAAQRLSTAVEWRAALDSILDAASELVRFERGTLALADSVQETLKIEAARNSPIDVSQMSRFKVGEGIAGWALSHRQPVLVRDSRNDPRFKASDPSHQPRSFIAVPLLEGNDGLGVLTLVRSANDPFTDEDLKNLARVGSDAARALTNARLVDFLKQRQAELTTLVRKTGDLFAATEVKDAVAIICRSACELAGGSAALVALQDSKGQLEVIGSQNIPAEVLRDRIAWSQPAALDVIRSGQPWVAAMKEILPAALFERAEAAGMRLLASIPCMTAPATPSAETELLLRAEPGGDPEQQTAILGVIHVYRSTLDPFSPAPPEQLQRFADQAAAALKR